MHKGFKHSPTEQQKNLSFTDNPEVLGHNGLEYLLLLLLFFISLLSSATSILGKAFALTPSTSHLPNLGIFLSLSLSLSEHASIHPHYKTKPLQFSSLYCLNNKFLMVIILSLLVFPAFPSSNSFSPTCPPQKSHFH